MNKNNIFLYGLSFIVLLISCVGSSKLASNNDEMESVDLSPIGKRIDDTLNAPKSDTIFTERKIIYRSMSTTGFSFRTESGKITVNICINRDGIVDFAEIDFTNTTIKNKKVLKDFLLRATEYKYQPQMDAPIQQCGKLKFVLNATSSPETYKIEQKSLQRREVKASN